MLDPHKTLSNMGPNALFHFASQATGPDFALWAIDFSGIFTQKRA
jgi:hypothetical protein